jgi:hypothetical protein
MPTEDERREGAAPDKSQPDQPPRDDLIDPEDVDPEEDTGRPPDIDAGVVPPAEERPESQGYDVMDAEHLTEDDTSRRRLSDEEAETSD